MLRNFYTACDVYKGSILRVGDTKDEIIVGHRKIREDDRKSGLRKDAESSAMSVCIDDNHERLSWVPFGNRSVDGWIGYSSITVVCKCEQLTAERRALAILRTLNAGHASEPDERSPRGCARLGRRKRSGVRVSEGKDDAPHASSDGAIAWSAEAGDGEEEHVRGCADTGVVEALLYWTVSDDIKSGWRLETAGSETEGGVCWDKESRAVEVT